MQIQDTSQQQEIERESLKVEKKKLEVKYLLLKSEISVLCQENSKLKKKIIEILTVVEQYELMKSSKDIEVIFNNLDSVIKRGRITQESMRSNYF